MKKLTLLGSVMLIAVALFAAPSGFTCETQGPDQLQITFKTPAWTIQNDHIILAMDPDRLGAEKIGDPNVPVFSTLVAVSAGNRVEVECSVDDLETREHFDLAPVSTPDGDAVTRNTLLYHSRQTFPEAWATVSNPMVMRGMTFVRLTVHPFRYTGALQELSIAGQLNLTLHLIADASANRPARPGIAAGDFGTMVSPLVVNPEALEQRDGGVHGSFLYIYTGETAVMNVLQYLVEWRERRGFEVHVASTADIGATSSQIKAYIQNAYDTWENPPEYVCLVGDATDPFKIPTFYTNIDDETVYGDLPYSELDGNDELPDIQIGRLPFGTIAQLSTMISKLLHYEKYPLQNDPNWLEHVLLVGDPRNSGVSTVLTMNYIQTLIESYDPSLECTDVFDTPFVQQTANALDAGMGVYFYRGFGDFSDWEAEDTSALRNVDMTPPMCAITCYSGAFATEAMSLIEGFLWAGSSNAPTGSVGVIGSSTATHTCFNNIITAGVGRALYQEGVTTFAEALNRGKLALYESYPENPNEFTDWYMLGKNFLGDPGMDVWTRTPDSLIVSAPTSCALGENSVAVHVTTQAGVPVHEACVSVLMGSTVFSTASTDVNGDAVVYFTPLTTAGTIKLTVSGHNLIPWLQDVPVAQSNAFAAFGGISDSANLQAGADGSFRVILTNTGTATLPGGSATLTCSDSALTVTQGTSAFASIAPGANQTSQSIFTFHADYDLSAAEPVPFTLTVSFTTTPPVSQTLHFTVPFVAPDVECTAINATTGGLLPGQTATLTVTLHNAGTLTFPAGNLYLRSLSPLLIVTDSLSTITALSAGVDFTNTANPFAVSVVDSTIAGQELQAELILGDPTAFYQVIPVTLTAGTAGVNDPTGPDAHGYWIYDNGDTGYSSCPTYNWIELDPNQGGSGTLLDLHDSDTEGAGDCTFIRLPFNFSFYGSYYNTITISSNGYIMPGTHETSDWMNFPIPGPLVPHPMIAPFWDDLIIGDDSGVYYQYDATRHALIVEWSRLYNRYDNSEETFEAILYDMFYAVGTTGDSWIDFQYKVVNNTDIGLYNEQYCDHGEYSSVGITDVSGGMGLQYTYDNLYTPTAPALHNEMALRFSGPVNFPPYPDLSLGGLSITDDSGDGIINSGETIHLALTLRNLGTVTATGISASLAITDDYVTLTQTAATYPDLSHGQTSTGSAAFVFSVANSCPDGHSIPLHFTLNYNGREDEIVLYLAVSSPCLTYTGFQFTDDNDNQMQAGEAGQFTLSFARTSSMYVENAAITLSTDNDNFIITPTTIEIPEITETSFTRSFTVQAQTGAVNGDPVVFNVHLAFNQYFSADYQFTYVVGVPEILIEEHFASDQFDTEIWATWYNTVLESNNYAGGTGLEALTDAFSNSGGLVSLPFDSNDIQKATLSCRYRKLSGTVPAVFLLEEVMPPYNSMVFMQDNSGDQGVQNLTLEKSPDQPFTQPAVLGMVLTSGSGTQMALDDIVLSIIRHNPGYVSGHVTIVGGDAAVTDVTISSSDNSVHPNADGSYQIACHQGNVTLTATAPGYAEYSSGTLLIEHDQNVTLNITMNHLSAPSNLQYALDGRLLHLTWNYTEGERTRAKDASRRSDGRLLDHFLIYQVYNHQTITTSTCTDTACTKYMVVAGNYTYYVYAVHTDGELSLPSNAINLDYVGVDDPGTVPPTFALYPNSPNPFNPDTRIRFDLPEAANRCEVAVYNMRGERVKVLADGTRAAGSYTLTWNGRNDAGQPVAGGVYFLRLETEKHHAIRKMVMMK